MTTITASPPRTDSRWPGPARPTGRRLARPVGRARPARHPHRRRLPVRRRTTPHGGDVSLLRLVPVEVATPLFAGVLLTAAVAALAMSRPAARPPGPLRALLAGYGWAVAFVLVLVVPDVRVLIVLGYLPILIVGAPFGWPPVDYADDLQLGAVRPVRRAGRRAAAGRCGARLAAPHRRGLRGLRPRPHRPRVDHARPPPPAGAAWAAGIAAAIPFTYALTRFAWAAGIPLGISREFLDRDAGHRAGLGRVRAGRVRHRRRDPHPRAGAALGRAVPALDARPRRSRVPVKLAVVPATLVAISVTAASLGLLSNPKFWRTRPAGSASTGAPMLLWPLWGVALGAATYAYHLRRRGACRRCGRR